MQTSLLSSRHYYFELLHKQDDHGSDHVEVGWRVFLPSFKFEVIDSPYISLYTVLITSCPHGSSEFLVPPPLAN
ncbi:UNVERIFIED_CONTAM: N-acetyl-beta-glucosaminyl-glycoprotein 4-beta-N-acetylgalactosaminyltransferase 1 [Gekko kuhli]